jgi:DNA-binding CsgD family transcriptional regulator
VVRLSSRQRQVLWLLSRGYSCKQIAVQLGIGYPAVVRHVRALKRKLSADSLTQAGLLARAFFAGVLDSGCCFFDFGGTDERRV